MKINIIPLCLLLNFFSGLSLQAKDLKKPNIVYVLADDMGYGDVRSTNPQSKLKTPHLDKLSQAGISFTDAHSNSSVCTPTRYGVLTGRYAWRTWLKKSVIGGAAGPLIDPNRTTVADILKKAGYHTAMIGKWHLGWDFKFTEDSAKQDPLYWGWIEGTKIDYSAGVTNGPDVLGFDYYYAHPGSLGMPPFVYVENGVATDLNIDKTFKGYPGKQVICPNGTPLVGTNLVRGGPKASNFDHQQTMPEFIDKACGYIEEKSKENQPFFLYLALPAPHTPILPLDKYKGKSGINEFADFVMQIDDHIGQLVDTLKKQGVYEDTIFIFTTDNGTSPRTDIPQLNEHGHDPSGGLRGRKADIYEGGHRVPYIVTWSNGGVKPNSISHEVICLTDLIATCAEIVGVKLDDADAVDSVSHLAAMRGEKSPALRKGIVHHSLDGSFAIRSGDWKLIFCASAGAWKYSDLTSEEAQKQGLPDYQLYNLKDDLAETKNLYNKHPDKMCELTALMAEIISKGRSTPGAPQANTGETPFLPHEEKMSQIKKINLVD